MGPFPLSAQKNKYVLVIGDYFTRYMEAYAIPNQNAENVSHKLVMEFISRYGIPLELHSDQGRNFESDLFKEVLNLLEIKKTRTTAYRPSSNGLIERFNGTLGKMIQKYINSNPINWDKHINLLLAAYRSTVHPSTGYTPNMLMFGREVNLPANLLFPFPRDVDHTETHEYLYQLRDKVEECYHLARENLKEASERQKRDHDTRIYERTYQKGDLVYKRTGPRRKLDDKFEGPFIVKHMFSPDIYEIIGKKKTFVVHHDRLKPFQSEEIPKWARSLQGKISKAC
ncbi:protein NYNRIN-like [Ruditapes philippinarum]|jgi:transposase InsO family protein|uniref:protein NYNRIN-like n=1 Tax=Ruditapes philippinarum TaxID=129788 RepID=UPI00295C1441|nr:protein NYNRIN-like [Ruditapes philippinarum]